MQAAALRSSGIVPFWIKSARGPVAARCPLADPFARVNATLTRSAYLPAGGVPGLLWGDVVLVSVGST